MSSDVDVRTNREVGLRLPDGTEIFPPNTWHGRGVDTAENRKVILDALIQSATNLSVPAEELLGRYAWVTRTSQTVTVKIPGESEERPLDDRDLTYVEPTDGEEFLEADVVEEQPPN